MVSLSFSRIARLLAWTILVSSTLGIIFMIINGIKGVGLLQFVSLFIASVIYLVLDDKKGNPTCSRLPVKVLMSSSWLLFSVAMFSLVIEDSLSRGLLFFILVSASISISLLFGLSSTDIRNLDLILLALLLTLFISTFYLGGIFQYQEDPGMYMDWTQSVIQSGHVISDIFGRHSGIPDYNIWQAEIILTSGLSIINIQVFSTALFSFLFLTLAYIVYNGMGHSHKLSYLATILTFVYPVALKWFYVQDSRAFAMIFVLLGILSTQYLLKSPHSRNILLLLVSWVAILNTHYFYAIVFVSFIFVPLFVLFIMTKFVGVQKIPVKTILSVLLLSIVTYLGKVFQYKNITSIFVRGLFLIISLGYIKSLVIGGSSSSIGGVAEYFPFLFYLFLITVGGLVYLRKIEFHNSNSIFTVLLVGISLGVTPVILKIGMFVLSPKRLLYFLSVIFGFLSAISVYIIYQRLQTKSPRISIVISFLLAFILVFTSITSNLSNQMDPMFYGNPYPVLFFHTTSERSMTFFVDKYLVSSTSILSDYRTISKGAVPVGWNKTRVVRIENISQIKNFDGYIVFSRISLDKSFLFKIGSGYGSEPIPLSLIDEEICMETLNRNKIFDGIIIVYR